MLFVVFAKINEMQGVEKRARSRMKHTMTSPERLRNAVDQDFSKTLLADAWFAGEISRLLGDIFRSVIVI